jgi:putative glutathione S-transferase
MEASPFRNTISGEHERFQPESDRYHLYISYFCPFAHRAFLALSMKGLRDHIGLSVVHPTMQKTKPEVDEHLGWVFRAENDEPVVPVTGHNAIPCTGCIPDSVNNAKTLREIYDLAGSAPTRYSVPVLWDKKEKTIVNNDSADILRIFNSSFNQFATNKELDLYPEHLRKQIDEINELVFPNVNLGVYKCGFAKNQLDYDDAFNNLFLNLNKLEEILSKSRYLCGDQLTEADIKLWTTLLRFDEIYYVYFKCNQKKIVDFTNLLNYCRDIYQTPGVDSTVNMDHIRNSYYSTHPYLNTYSIIPGGCDFLGELKKPHNRK